MPDCTWVRVHVPLKDDVPVLFLAMSTPRTADEPGEELSLGRHPRQLAAHRVAAHGRTRVDELRYLRVGPARGYHGYAGLLVQEWLLALLAACHSYRRCHWSVLLLARAGPEAVHADRPKRLGSQLRAVVELPAQTVLFFVAHL